MHLDFTVPGKPVPWSVGQDKQGRRYKPPRLRAWQAVVQGYALEAVNEPGSFGPFPAAKGLALCLEIIVYVERPKSVPLSVRYPTSKPDATNLQKAIEDAMTKLVYPDDAQVVSPCCHKRFAQPGDEAHVRIRVWEAGKRPGMWG